MTRVVFLFVDGIGLGPPAPTNPFSTVPLPALQRLSDGGAWTTETAPVRRKDTVFIPIDATLGLEGLPQSGTGQAALLTGVNAAEIHGRHFGPYPPTTVRPLVARESVFQRLVRRGVSPEALAFANAYPDRFFRFVEARGRWTTTTLAAHAAGVRLRTEADLAAGHAIPADLTGNGWRTHIDPGFAPFDEAETAARVAALADAHRLTLVEYSLTDKAGHSRDPGRAASVLASLDRFVSALLDRLDPAATLLLLTSDHGNVEALDVKTHTRNAVPLAVRGDGAGAFHDARSLLDVAPRLVRLLAGDQAGDAADPRPL